MNDNAPLDLRANFDAILHELTALDLRLLNESTLPEYEARATLASMHIVHGCYATIVMLGDNARATIRQMLEEIEW